MTKNKNKKEGGREKGRGKGLWEYFVRFLFFFSSFFNQGTFIDSQQILFTAKWLGPHNGT